MSNKLQIPKHFEDFLRGFGSQSLNMPEGLRYAANDISTELLASMKGGVGETSTHFTATPRSSGSSIFIHTSLRLLLYKEVF